MCLQLALISYPFNIRHIFDKKNNKLLGIFFSQQTSWHNVSNCKKKAEYRTEAMTKKKECNKMYGPVKKKLVCCCISLLKKKLVALFTQVH